jgi:anti-sigma regulatory factor (Ser/Thr protein kinase)
VGNPAGGKWIGESHLIQFGADDLRLIRRTTAQWAARAGLAVRRADDFVIAVSEIATNAVRHGSSRAVLRLSTESDGTVAVAEVRDRGLWVTPDRAEEQGRMGLALAHRVCDEVDIRAESSGTTVLLRMGVSD